MRKITIVLDTPGESKFWNKLDRKGFLKIKMTVLFMAMFCAFVSAAWGQSPTIILDVTQPPFNAVGDGSADNYNAIQSAIDYFEDNEILEGGTVYFPSGFYNVSNTLKLKSNVQLQGTGSWNNCQLRLTAVEVPLFEVENKFNITFKDLTLMGWSRQIWPRSEKSEVQRIRERENTTGISFKAGETGINNIAIENVRIIQFTRGIWATSTVPNNDANITNVKIRNYVSDGNEYSLHTNTSGADNWDVQNMNVYPMYKDQNGIFLERSGQMRFLQLSCAGVRIGADWPGICAILGENGDLYFRNKHVEGPKLGFLAEFDPDAPENNSRLIVENSASDGEFYRATKIFSINNRFWLDWSSIPRFKFFDNGAYSSVQTCSDVWVGGPATHTSVTSVDLPTDAFPGLIQPPLIGCLNSTLFSAPIFDQGYIADDNLPLLNGEVNVRDHCSEANCSETNHTDAFKNALAAARTPLAKRRLFVPSGTYNIDETLELFPGETIRGSSASIIRLNASNKSIFRIVANPAVVKGITLRNLTLTAAPNLVGTAGIVLETAAPKAKGAGASDFQIQNVDFQYFETGILVRPFGGIPTNTHPMFDSVSVKDAVFDGNKTAIGIDSLNASNWNLENITVYVPFGEKGVRVNGAGVSSLRNLSCIGPEPEPVPEPDPSVCLTIQNQSAIAIDGLTATNVGNALVVTWENGYTQFPVTLRNSNLLAGVYIQGKVFLNSVSNIYPAHVGGNTSPKVVRIGGFEEGNSDNDYFGAQSEIFSCDDTFLNTTNMQPEDFWIYTGTLLLKPVTPCIIDDTF